MALCDFLTRRFLDAARQAGADQRTQSGGWSGAKGGEITIDEPGQHILERTSVGIKDGDGSVEARFTIAMPARGEGGAIRNIFFAIMSVPFGFYTADCFGCGSIVYTDYSCTEVVCDL